MLNRIYQAAKQLSVKRDKYDEFVFVLRNIRESYQISQKEMAGLLNVTQGTISKFESADLTLRLDFLLSYASTLGYQVIVCSESKYIDDELSRYHERQSRISRELSDMENSQIEGISASLLPKVEVMSEATVREHKNRIITELLEAKKNIEESAYLKFSVECSINSDSSSRLPDDIKERQTTKILSRNLGVSERMIRRFEGDDDYMPTAHLIFKYASFMCMDLRLLEKCQNSESVGTFYMRNCLVLNNAFAKSIDILEKIHRPGDKYAELVFVLHSIRESYQVSQKEMAIFLDVSQSTISKFETGNPDVRLDFLLFYASLLGYNIKAVRKSGSESELSRFNENQLKISKELLNVKFKQIDHKFHSRVHRTAKWPTSIIEKSRKSIIFELVIAKHTFNNRTLMNQIVYDEFVRRYRTEMAHMLTDALEEFETGFSPEMRGGSEERSIRRSEGEKIHMSFVPKIHQDISCKNIDTIEELATELLAKKLSVSERTIRRFENEQNYIPSASFVFRYASLVDMELRLENDYDIDNMDESFGDSYIRRSLALYDWIRNPPNVIPTGA